MVTVTNGDGPVHRNVLDGATDDPLAYSARVNWDIMGHMGYEEGALRQRSCEWTAAVGAWVHYFVDHCVENPLAHDTLERLTYGVDAAVGWGGFSMTAAYSMRDLGRQRRQLRRSTALATWSSWATCSPTRRGRSRRATARTTSSSTARRRLRAATRSASR